MRTASPVGLALVIATAISLVGAGAASAAEGELFVSPSGRGAQCTQADPCSIVKAIHNATAGQTVTVETGTYGSPTPLSKALTVEAGVTVSGQAGPSRPVIVTEGPSGIILAGEGSSLSNLEVQDASGEYGVLATAAAISIDHVISHVSAAGAVACQPSAELTDSVCWSSGSNGVAALPLAKTSGSSTLRNDTLIASGGGGVALAVRARRAVTVTANLTNSIARGAGFDISAATETSGAGTTAIVNADHSNYATVAEEDGVRRGTVTITPAGTAGNQTAAPVFVDESTGDFHEASTSAATIGKGANSPLDGSTDLDGGPRELLGVTDIGAYEFSPPPSCTSVAASAGLDHPVAIQLLCTDLAGAPLTYAVATSPMHGSISLNQTTGLLTYTPKLGYSGADSFTYYASSRNGTAAAASASITVSAVAYHVPGLSHSHNGGAGAPVLANVRESTRRWREGDALARLSASRRPPFGTTFSFALSEAATVRFTFTRQAVGREVAGRCVAADAKNQRRRRCPRTVIAGVLAVAGHAGAEAVRFEGLLSRHKRLARGSYKVLVSATASGEHSKTSVLRLTIV